MSLIGKSALTLFGALTLLPASAKVQDEINQVYDFDAKGTIELSNINGDVTITACDCNQVTLRAEISASTQALRDRISVEIDASTSRLSVKTEYQKAQDKGYNQGHSRVDYTLMVPNQVNLDEIELVNGNLTIKGVSGTLDADLVNGNLSSDGSAADIKVDSVNGNVDIELNRFDSTKRIDLESVNGTITLRLPNLDDVNLDASTVNGSLSNDFGVAVKKHKWVGASMAASNGSGAVKVELENVNGAIRVLQR